MPINITKSSMPSYNEYCKEIKCLWNNHWLTNMGEKHNFFQKQLEAYLEIPHVSLFVNGHLALEIIINAMNFKRGSEIITTPFTFSSTTHAIVRNGLKPVFCDINIKDYTIDVNKIENLINKNTCAIIPVHVYGNICSDDAIEDIAKKHGLKVIYDAAHAFGVTVKGKSIANMGDASMYSFHATKVFNTIEGGAICSSDDQMVEALEKIKNFGQNGNEDCEYIGCNAKMNEFQAAMGICNLRHLKKEILKRKVIVERYRERLSNINGIKLNEEQENVQSNYAYFPLLFDNYKLNRDQIFEKLEQHNINTRKYFYPLTNKLSCYKKYKFNNNDISIAYYVSKHILTLPLYSDLSISEVDKICDIILE